MYGCQLLNIAFKFLIGMSCLFWIANQDVSSYVLSISISIVLIIIADFLIFRRYLKSNKLLYWFRRYAKRWLFLFIGLAWGSLNILVWFNYSNSIVTAPKVSTLTGFVCSLIPETKNPAINNKGKTPKRQSISFDFCVTNMVDSVTVQTLITDLETPKLNILSNNKIKLSIYNFNSDLRSTLVSGETLSLTAKIKPIHGRMNPGGSDYEKWLVAESYIATGYVKKLEISPPNESGIFTLIKQSYNFQRQNLFSHLENITSANQFQGLILALSVGEKSMISSEQWNTFRDSGTSHLLAISGLHIGIASLWSYYLVYFIIVFWNFLTKGRYFISPIKPAILASITGGVSIALISGLGYPAQRAVLMLLVFFFNKISQRHYSTPSVLSIAFILILLIQPFAMLAEGFWLSFLAVSIILLSLSYGFKSSGKHSRLLSWFRVNLFIFVGLTPISWYFFGQVSIVSLGANLILIPLTSFLTAPLVYLGMLASGFSMELSALFFNIADNLLKLGYWIQNEFANWNSDLPYFTSGLTLPDLVLLIVIVVLLLLPSKFPSKAIVLSIILVFLISLVTPKSNGTFKMVVFDIGQGLAIYIGINGKHMIYDTGYGNSDFAMADSVILPFLKNNDISHIDRLIISHGDSDHRGGLESIINGISVGQLYSGEKLVKKNSAINTLKQEIKLPNSQNCHTTKSWQWGSANFKFLNFRQEEDNQQIEWGGLAIGKSNNRSCVLSISVNDKTILLTGDIEKKAERLLVIQNIEQHDVIVVPHHGSLTSSNQQFVDKINAKEAIFSTGFANQWRFPKTKVVERYQRNGSNIWVTDKQGAIKVNLVEGLFHITAERERYRNFWNH